MLSVLLDDQQDVTNFDAGILLLRGPLPTFLSQIESREVFQEATAINVALDKDNF